MNAPDMIWLHPITEDSFQDQWWESGDDGDVPYVPAAALAEAHATIARLEAALQSVEKLSSQSDLRELARDELAQSKGEGTK